MNNGDLERLSQLARVYHASHGCAHRRNGGAAYEMVGRLAETVGEGLSLLDRLNRGGAGRLVEMLEHLESTGALERIANTLPSLMGRLKMTAGLFNCLEEAATESRRKPAAGGIGSLWRIMKDEDTVRSLQFLLSVSKQMQEKCASKHS